MSLQLDCQNDVLRFSGRLDADGGRQVDNWLNRASTVPPVWDLAQLDFLSSAGIRSLLLLNAACGLAAVGRKL